MSDEPGVDSGPTEPEDLEPTRPVSLTAPPGTEAPSAGSPDPARPTPGPPAWTPPHPPVTDAASPTGSLPTTPLPGTPARPAPRHVAGPGSTPAGGWAPGQGAGPYAPGQYGPGQYGAPQYGAPQYGASQYGAAQYGAAHGAGQYPAGQYGQPSPVPAHLRVTAPTSRVPGWLWPAVSSLALVLGLLGGALGGAAYERWSDEALGSGGPATDTVSEDPAPLPEGNRSIAAVARTMLPSTVQIVATGAGEDSGATGSGFVLDGQGHVVTNNHVVAGAAAQDGRIEIVDQEGNRYRAELVGRSPVYDLAVLYASQVKTLRPAALGASRRLRVGDGVVAFGSPLGLTSTVTAGIVSAVNRPVTTGNSTDETSYINAVQTDAAINPGNSGGPLVNLAGQVVGVNSAIATTGGAPGGSGNIGVGFAIPIEQVRVTASQILRDGEARYPVIGATVQTGQDDVVGARIDEVLGGAPADRAGLRKDDLITEIDGDRVMDGIALIVAIRSRQPGDTVTFLVVRDGREREVRVRLDSKVG